MNAQYDVSVVVTTYNSKWVKVLMTLRSILLQKNVKFQIVVADDGSTQNWFNEIVQLFNEYGFRDYVLISKCDNQGTLKNYLAGVHSCQGKYVKGIAPGDMLYGELALAGWHKYIIKQQAVVSFAQIANYKVVGSRQMTVVPAYAHPQNIEAYNAGGERLRETYLLCDDIATGVSMLCERETLVRYTEFLYDKVKYAEDNAYRLMIYDRVKTCWYDECSILYELGTGISTSGDSTWARRIYDDWIATNRIMGKKLSSNDKFDIQLGHVFRAKEMTPEQSMKYLNEHVPEVIAMKQSIASQGIRMTPVVVKRDFLQDVLRGITEF